MIKEHNTLSRAEKIDKEIAEKIDKEINEMRNKNKYYLLIYLGDYTYFGTDESEDIIQKDVLNMAKTHLENNYYDNEDYVHYKFNINVTACSVEVDAYELLNIKRKKEREMEEKEELRKINELNAKIDKKKQNRYKGIINPKGMDKALYYPKLAKMRDDLEKVNEGQYKIIYNDPVNSANTTTGKIDFAIKSNEPFYSTSEDFKSKKQLIEFLEKASKVSIHPDVALIPFKYKNDDSCYVMAVDNDDESLQKFRLNSFGYFNKQHNIYYYIEMNCEERFLADFKRFNRYIIKHLKKYSVLNKKVLYKVYNYKVNNFKKESIITNQY